MDGAEAWSDHVPVDLLRHQGEVDQVDQCALQGLSHGLQVRFGQRALDDVHQNPPILATPPTMSYPHKSGHSKASESERGGAGQSKARKSPGQFLQVSPKAPTRASYRLSQFMNATIVGVRRRRRRPPPQAP